MNNFWINLFNHLEYYTHPTKITKSKKFFYRFLIPYFFIIEYFVRLRLWKKIIVPELITNDNVITFLDKQEFSYKNGIIFKQDLIESNEYFDRLDLNNAKEVIKKEYIETLDKLFQENIQINIEDWITILINVDFKYVQEKQTGELIRGRIYEVKIQFCREFFYLRARKYFLIWVFIISILSSIPLFLFYSHLIIK